MATAGSAHAQQSAVFSAFKALCALCWDQGEHAARQPASTSVGMHDQRLLADHLNVLPMHLPLLRRALISKLVKEITVGLPFAGMPVGLLASLAPPGAALSIPAPVCIC
jgi:hypothetical protein